MTDRPIIFSAPMVRALLEGRKTQTRRLIKPAPQPFLVDGAPCEVALEHVEGDPWPRIRLGRVITAQEVRYRVGMRLWVRETWCRACAPDDDDKPATEMQTYYCADGDPFDRWLDPDTDQWRDGVKWRPSIHMPRWASRLTLTVTDVRVQELLDISEEDAAAEGCSEGRFNDGFGPTPIGDGLTIESPGGFYSAAGAFQMLWQKIHPDWDGFSSPHVVALTFTVEQRNIDA